MTDATRQLAARAGIDPHFLAFALAAFAAAEGLDDAALAAALDATPDALASARLCRTPRPDPAGFREDVVRIAAKFGLNRDRLAAMVRHGQATAELRRAAAEVPADSATPALAARDRTE